MSEQQASQEANPEYNPERAMGRWMDKALARKDRIDELENLLAHVRVALLEIIDTASYKAGVTENATELTWWANIQEVTEKALATIATEEGASRSDATDTVEC